MKTDDYYDTLTTKTITGRQSNSGLYASHDGKTLISVGLEPELKIYRVQADGSLVWVQDWNIFRFGQNTTVHFSPDDRWAYLIGESYNPVTYDRNQIGISFSVDADTSRLTEMYRLDKRVWPYGYAPDNLFINAYTSSISPDGRYIIIPHRMVREQISRIGVVRVDGPYMTPLPIQPEIQTTDYFNSSGIAMFNTNATDPGWAGYE